MAAVKKTKWAARPRRTSDYITMRDRVKLLDTTNGKLLDEIDRLRGMLVAWVSLPRAGNRFMSPQEKALYDEGLRWKPKEGE